MHLKCRILLLEFKAVLRKIISNYPGQEIAFSEFMEFLAASNIRVYSRAQIGKLGKIFNNPLKVCRIEVPLSHLLLDCVQDNEKQKFFIVKVSPFPINSGLYQIKTGSKQTHSPQKCVHALTRVLKKLHGSQKNWFRVLGGFTIAMSIDQSIFKRNVAKVLCHSPHTGCVELITAEFLKECSGDDIEWKAFMKVIGEWSKSIDVDVFSLTKCNFDKKLARDQSSKGHLKRNRLHKTQYCVEESSVDLNRTLSFSTQKCVLYQKKNYAKQSNSEIFGRLTKCSRFGTHRWKTSPNFYSSATKTQQSFKELKSATQGEFNQHVKNSQKKQLCSSQNQNHRLAALKKLAEVKV